MKALVAYFSASGVTARVARGGRGGGRRPLRDQARAALHRRRPQLEEPDGAL